MPGSVDAHRAIPLSRTSERNGSSRTGDDGWATGARRSACRGSNRSGNRSSWITHSVLAYLLAIVIAAHISAVLLHTILLRDGILSRMTFGLRRGF